MSCTKCGSHAINHHLHGRDGSDGDLCDVCYWRVRAGRIDSKELAALNRVVYSASVVVETIRDTGIFRELEDLIHALERLDALRSKEGEPT